MFQPNLKDKDYEILSEIKEANDGKRLILGKSFRSSTKVRRLGFLKKQGYIAKEGRQKGEGTLFLTDLGKYALQTAEEEAKELFKPFLVAGQKAHDSTHIITVKALNGSLPFSLEMHTKASYHDILEALSKIGRIEKRKSEAEGGSQA